MMLLITILLSFVFVAAAVAVMSIGVIRGRSPIRGSCGGLNGRGCELCGSESSSTTQCRRRVR